MGRSQVVLLVVGCIAAIGTGVRQAGADLTPAGGPRPAYFLDTDKAVYQLGEQVHAVHRLTNEGDEDYRLQKITTPVFDLWVLDIDGDKIWSYNMIVLPGNAGWLTVAPGESVLREYTWDMTDYQGNFVSPGAYELVGVIYGGAHVRTGITVVPEPTTLGVVLAGFGFAIIRRGARR